MKRIGVIGTVNRDTIVWPDGREAHSLGGILYTALALAHLGGDQIETWLLGAVGEDVLPDLEPLLKTCPRLRREGLKIVPPPNAHSHIQYYSDGSKNERLTGRLESVQAADIGPLLPQLDGLLVNFISGFELELATFALLRQRLQGPVLMDIHSLTLGRKTSGERFWKCPSAWRDWVRLVDVIQMNEAEAALLADLALTDEHLLGNFARQLLELGPRGAVVTRGEKGCLGAYREGGEIRHCQLSALEVEKAIDPTGCGDVFLAGLAVGILAGWDLPRAAELARRAAALNSRLEGVEQLGQLEALQHS